MSNATNTRLCHCLFPAKLRVSNSVENPNEEYYTCMNRGSPRPSCKYFVWVQGEPLSSSAPVASAPSTPTSRRQGPPRTPRSPRAPTVAGLTAQVEQLELDKERLEDECVELKYELTEALRKFGEALGKYSALKSKSSENTDIFFGYYVSILLPITHPFCGQMSFLGRKAKELVKRDKRKSKAIPETGSSNLPSSSKRPKHNTHAPSDPLTTPNDPYRIILETELPSIRSLDRRKHNGVIFLGKGTDGQSLYQQAGLPGRQHQQPSLASIDTGGNDPVHSASDDFFDFDYGLNALDYCMPQENHPVLHQRDNRHLVKDKQSRHSRR
ncbi:hypothetical protein BS47DRAFT_1387684 [Hydnum rufescens UP504]|uniref:Zinc finger GRF-type domain-containing protein n=1 Tax=Hydnum rufescens UP504 TaxID=1448309 RepID=A0A9P6B9M1_9AGAM|nr:hypothetical protein BS47DRAFT_1387684 [Hydnum rufescens UP504]